ncbi:MAG: ParA family protein [Spirochaetia bacterium]|jgi:cellulose biosynthesis protein BcsQ
MNTIAVYNIKGGVGKSTAAVNLACLAGRGGHATLLWDLDPQGAAGYYLGQAGDTGKGSGKLTRGKERLRDLAVATAFPNLDLIPSRFSYRRLDIHLHKRAHRRTVLSGLLAPLAAKYRWVFLDCPPGITLLSENIFAAADILLVPLVPTPLSLRTFEEIVVFYQRKGLDRARVLPFFSLVERRKRIHRETMEIFAARESRVCRAVIPSLSQIERMALTRRPPAYYQPRSEAGRAYGSLWAEIMAAAEPGTGRGTS